VKEPATQVLKTIRRSTRRHFSAEDKIRIVLEGLRGEDSIAELCRREGIVQNLYYRWSKEFSRGGQEAPGRRYGASGDVGRGQGPASRAGALKEVVAELTLENRLLKKA
jgi:transposase